MSAKDWNGGILWITEVGRYEGGKCRITIPAIKKGFSRIIMTGIHYTGSRA